MHFKTVLSALVLSAALSLAACKSDSPAHSGSAGSGAKPPSAEEMTAMMIKQGSPSEGHKRLEPMVGKFQAKVKLWMAPGTPPQESSGVMTNKWVIGGRFLQSEYLGEAMGMKFEGMGLMGYDNAKQRYVGTWVDSFGTSMWPVGLGTLDASGKVITTTRTMEDMNGGPMKTRDVTKIVSNNEYNYEIYNTGADGKEMKALEIHYTRM